MIELVNVSKYYPTDFGRHYVFRDVSLVLPPDKSVGVLGPNGAGKSTFLRLLGGADVPNEGRILRTGRISPPMGLTPGLQSALTAGENARFAGRIHGLPRDEINDLIEYVRELADIGKFFDMPIGTYSAGMKQRVAFAINMSMDFDYYIFDEISAGGDKEFRKITKARVQERLQTSKFIIASHRTDELLDICNAGIVIQNGELTFFDDIKDALAFYGGDDDVPETRPRRGRRRDAEPAAEAAAGVPEPQQDGAGAGPAASAVENRKSRREDRRRKLVMEEQAAAPAEIRETEPEAAAAGMEPVADEAPQKRRRRRPEEPVAGEQPAAPPETVAETQDGVAASEDPAPPATRPRRRRHALIAEEQSAAAGLASDAAPETSAAGAATPEPAVPEPAAKEPAATAPDAPADGREARRERRRHRLAIKRERLDATPSEAVEAPPELIAASATPGAAEDLRKARLERRRRKLEQTLAAAAGDGTNTGTDAAPQAEETALGVQPAPEPSLLEPVRSPMSPPPVGAAPMAERRKPPSAPAPEAPAQSAGAAPAVVMGADAPPARPESPVSASFKGLLIQRVVLRQQRAAISAARAARLLLQHLEEAGTAGPSTLQARAWLAAAAQETAAHDAAQARMLIESLAAGETSAAPLPSAASRAAGDPSSPGGQTPGGRIPATSAANTER